MQYFYDHQTDAVSFIIGDFSDYDRIEELSPGIVMYLDRRARAIAIEIRGANNLVDTKGLVPLYARNIEPAEVQRRMSASPAAEKAWKTVSLRS